MGLRTCCATDSFVVHGSPREPFPVEFVPVPDDSLEGKGLGLA
jgi:hypothetical protein